MHQKKTFAVIGCGRFGASLARELSSMGQEVLAVDKSKEMVDALGEVVTVAVQADVTQEGALDGIGLHNVDTAIIAMSSDFEASVMATTICREKKIHTIIAKAMNERHGRILQRMGAQKLILPEREMGVRLAHSLVEQTIYDRIRMSDQFSVEELALPQSWVNRHLNELNLRTRAQISVVAIQRDGELEINPDPDFYFEEGDVVYALGPNDALERLKR